MQDGDEKKVPDQLENSNENDEGEEIPIEINEAPKTPAADAQENEGGEDNVLL